MRAATASPADADFTTTFAFKSLVDGAEVGVNAPDRVNRRAFVAAARGSSPHTVSAAQTSPPSRPSSATVARASTATFVRQDPAMTSLLPYFPALACGATCLGAMLF